MLQFLEKSEQDLFWLALVLLAVAFYVGFSTDLATGGNVLGHILVLAQGRNPATGEFAGYPKAA